MYILHVYLHIYVYHIYIYIYIYIYILHIYIYVCVCVCVCKDIESQWFMQGLKNVVIISDFGSTGMNACIYI